MCAAVIIDTESSGLFDYGKPAEAEGQPRMAEIAMLYCDDDLNIIDEFDALIRPDGWEMSEEAISINGLTMDKLLANGKPIVDVLPRYIHAIESGNVFVGHNVRHDLKLCRGECRRAGLPDLFEQTKNICTMRAAIGVCKIKKAKGAGYKFPKLAEAYRHFFKREIDGAHSAIVDARACLDIFRKLKEIGCCPEAAVFHAKEGTRAGQALQQRLDAEQNRRFARGEGDGESTEETEGALPKALTGLDEGTL